MWNMLCIGFRVRPLPKASSTCIFMKNNEETVKRILTLTNMNLFCTFQKSSENAHFLRTIRAEFRNVLVLKHFRNFLLLFPKKTNKNWQTLNFKVSVTWIEKHPSSFACHSFTGILEILKYPTGQLDTKLDTATWAWFTGTYVIIFKNTNQSCVFVGLKTKSCLLDGVQNSKCSPDPDNESILNSPVLNSTETRNFMILFG